MPEKLQIIITAITIIACSCFRCNVYVWTNMEESKTSLIFKLRKSYRVLTHGFYELYVEHPILRLSLSCSLKVIAPLCCNWFYSRNLACSKIDLLLPFLIFLCDLDNTKCMFQEMANAKFVKHTSKQMFWSVGWQLALNLFNCKKSKYPKNNATFVASEAAATTYILRVSVYIEGGCLQ
jgi:hypothetical protein